MGSDLEVSRNETAMAFKNRALLYRFFYEEFKGEFGEEKVTELMKKAIYRWGSYKSEKYKDLADKKDFKGIAEEFIRTSPCGGNIFKPDIVKVDSKSAVIEMKGCPLVDAWKEMGLSSDEVIKMCEIANATDYGKYEGMGFKLTIESTLAKDEGKCILNIQEKE